MNPSITISFKYKKIESIAYFSFSDEIEFKNQVESYVNSIFNKLEEMENQNKSYCPIDELEYHIDDLIERTKNSKNNDHGHWSYHLLDYTWQNENK